MLRRALAIVGSIVLHVGVLALALVMLLRQPERPEIVIGSVPVTVVSEIQRQAAPTPAPAEEVFDEVTPDAVETPEPEAPEPAPDPTPTPPRPQPQRPTPPRPTPTPTPRPQPPQPRPDRPTPPRRETESLNLDDLTGGGQRQPNRPQRPGRPATESGAGDAPVATGQQVAEIAGQIIARWSFRCEIPGADSLTIRMRMSLDANGRITSGPTLVRPESGEVYRAVADSALRAARQAAPYQVPEGFRAQELPTLVFDTAAACRNR